MLFGGGWWRQLGRHGGSWGEGAQKASGCKDGLQYVARQQGKSSPVSPVSKQLVLLTWSGLMPLKLRCSLAVPRAGPASIHPAAHKSAQQQAQTSQCCRRLHGSWGLLSLTRDWRAAPAAAVAAGLPRQTRRCLHWILRCCAAGPYCQATWLCCCKRASHAGALAWEGCRLCWVCCHDGASGWRVGGLGLTAVLAEEGVGSNGLFQQHSIHATIWPSPSSCWFRCSGWVDTHRGCSWQTGGMITQAWCMTVLPLLAHLWFPVPFMLHTLPPGS